MRVERALVGLLCVVTAALAGCGGQLAYNLPPAARLMEPGPGVGGPGPGVIPPAGYPYGMYGGAVGRYGDGMGGYMGGGYGECASCPPNAANQQPTPQVNGGVQQASYDGAQQAQYAEEYGPDYGLVEAYGCGDEVGAGGHYAGGGCGDCGCADGGCAAGGCANGCGGCGGGGCGGS